MANGVDRFNNAASSTSRKVVGGLVDTGNVSIALTNLTASSDALGKPIPRTFGHVIIAGALVWASPYYIITRGFTQETQYWTDTDYHDIENADSSTLNGTRVTLIEKSQYGIDLCYSFGFEGQVGSRRKVNKFKVNGVVVYDALTGYVMPGIGFDIREGQDLDIPTAMAKYEISGKYFYPGQTLIVLQQFRTADWGGALPQSVEVEFVAETALGQVGGRQDDLEFPAGASWPGGLNSFIEADYRRLYFYLADASEFGSLLVFSMDTGEFLEELKLFGPGAGLVKSDNANHLNLSNHTLCGDLRALCSAKNGFGPGFVLDLKTGYCVGTGTDNCTGYVCVNSTSQDGYVIASDLFDLYRQNIILTRDGLSGNIEVSGRSSGPAMPFNGWWDIAHGYGKGFACAIKNDRLVIFNKAGGYTTTTLATEHKDRGASYISVIAYKGGAVALVGNGTAASSYYLISYNADCSVKAQRALGFICPTIRYPKSGEASDVPSDRYYGTAYQGVAYYTDLSVLTVQTYPMPFTFSFGFDKISNRLFGNIADTTGKIVINQSGPVLLDANIKIIDLIRELYATAGIYTRDQITGSPDLNDSVAGAILVANIDVIQFIDQLCSLYRIQKIERANGVYFYKTRTGVVGLKISAVIDVSELAIDLTENDDPTPIQSERQSEDTQPVAITLKYINSDLGYKEDEISWRRVDIQQSNGQELKISLPLVMKADEALALVQQAVVDSTASVFTHRFRLPPRLASILTAGDIVTIVDGAYRTTVDIDLLDYNGDLSGSVEATSIGQVNVANVPVPALNTPISNPTAGNIPGSVGYVIDSPIIVYSDKPNGGSIKVYESITSEIASESYQGGYFGRRLVNGDWGSLPTFVNNSQTVVFRAKSVLTNKRWTIDKDELTITRISGKLPVTKTITELQSDPMLNLAWYGKPGRWELIKFSSTEGGKISGGIMRGLRGTEINCGKHEIDDLIICAQVNIVNESRLSDVIGKPEEWRPVSVGRAFNSAASLPVITLEGNSARPFAVASILGQRRTDGALSLSWVRRDRAGTGWAQAVLPLSDLMSFRVRIMAADGITVIRQWMVGTEAAIYAAADRVADGTDAQGPIKVQIAQMSADNNVGAGFSETVTVNG